MKLAVAIACFFIFSGCSKSEDKIWRFSEDKDNLTDKVNYHLIFLPQDGSTDNAILIFSCSKAIHINAGLVTNHQISNPTDINYRVDNKENISRRVIVGESVIFIQNNVINPKDGEYYFINYLRGGNNIIIRFYSALNKSYDVVFNIKNFSDKLRLLEKSCDG